MSSKLSLKKLKSYTAKVFYELKKEVRNRAKNLIVGKKLEKDLVLPKTNKLIAKKGDILTIEILNEADEKGVLHNAFRFVEDTDGDYILPAISTK